MKNFRFLIFFLTVWLIIFFNIKHLFNLFENNTFIYIALLIISVLIILIPGTHKIAGSLIVALPTLFFLIANIWRGGYESIVEITMTASEALSIIVTLLLSYWVNISFQKYEKKSLEISNNVPEKILTKETNGLGYIYREVRRARNHNNPMAFLAIEIDEKSMSIIQNDEYKISKLDKNKEKNLIKIGNILCEELEECAIIVQGDDHFLVALPETKTEEIPIITERLRKQSKNQLGVDLSIGSASLPKDGYTFTGLFEKATSDMNTDIATKFFSEVKHSHTKQTIISGK